MNIYFVGMCVAMTTLVCVGIWISRKIQGAEDFYVAKRQAPVLLIAGSLIASYTSTGMFMGDASMFYDGAFSPMILLEGMQSAGYIIGAVFLGRYLRRSNELTIPAFFGFRFQSPKVRIMAAVVAIITMLVYSLSVLQGIGTLMTAVTSVNYNFCIILSMIVVTIIAVASGSRGVLITDTIMASLFTVAIMASALFISNCAGGWYSSVSSVTQVSGDLLSWGGKIGSGGEPGPLGYFSEIDNVIWGFINGIVWMSVCMTGPWQSSRYLMAKDEGTVLRAGFIAAIGVFLLEFLTGMAAVMVNSVNPNISPTSNVLIWASMNILPLFLGVILLTGILSAGLSSVTTFISLIGASVANDILELKEEKSIAAGRVAMIVAGVVVLGAAIVNSPSIFWIMFLGGSVVACSWMPVALASVFWKNLTRTGAFYGMLAGFIGCFAIRLVSTLGDISLPIYLEPNLVGITLNIIVMTVASLLTNVSADEIEAKKALLVIPETERKPETLKQTLTYAKRSIWIGVVVFLILALLWVIPYWQAK